MPVRIIAEGAQGPQGDSGYAALLSEAAAAAGADAIKFQIVFADELATPDHELYEVLVSSQMPQDEEWFEVSRACSDSGIDLICDVFGPRSLGVASAIGVSGIKIHGMDLLNTSLMELVRGAGVEEVYLGVGGSTNSEVAEAVAALRPIEPVLLLGHQAYPTPAEENQMCRIRNLMDAFPGLVVGWADHVPYGDPAGTWLSAAAIGAGASVIEKHLTLAGICQRRDFDAALDPGDFKLFADSMRLAERACQVRFSCESESQLSPSESKYRAMFKKHVVAAADVHKGQQIEAAHIVLKRSPSEHAILDPTVAIGRKLARDLSAGTPLSVEDFA